MVGGALNSDLEALVGEWGYDMCDMEDERGFGSQGQHALADAAARCRPNPIDETPSPPIASSCFIIDEVCAPSDDLDFMHLLIVIGTRPNFIKVTRFRKVLDVIPGAKLSLVHTGQHYDRAMSQVFFDQFGLRPTTCLNCTLVQAACNSPK